MHQTTANGNARVIAGIQQAAELHAKRETDAAIQTLSALIKEFPATAALHGYIAMFLSGSGRLNEAIDHAQRAVHLSPKSETTSFVLFEALCNAGQNVEVLDEMKRLLALRPSEEYSKLIEAWDLSESESTIK